MAQQITAFELEVLRTKATGFDLYKEYEALQERLKDVQFSKNQIDVRLQDLANLAKTNPEIVNPVPETTQENYIEMPNIDPDTGEVKAPVSKNKKK